MRSINYYILCIISITFWGNTAAFQTDPKPEIQLLTEDSLFVAGSDIVLQFSTSISELPQLYCSSSYGSTIITPQIENKVLNYTIPKIFSSKRGLVNWKLIDSKTSLSGQFKIISTQKVVKLETYIGPPSIEAGGRDYTTAVVIPTDSLDNPLEDGTKVQVKYLFQENQRAAQIFSKNLIAYRDIYSPRESGRMLFSSEAMNVNSKEFTVLIAPAIATDFTISAKRAHSYADGNQITTFTTSVIKDKQANIVSDGTFVNFIIRTKNGTLIKTSGATISGIAMAKMIHPDHEEEYTVKAYVVGMAESNEIRLNYFQTIKDFKVKFSSDNRIITVGPLQSFMNQMIPDGLQVRLIISQNDLEIASYLKTSFNGYAQFKLISDIFENAKYDITIETASLTKSFNDKELW